MLFNHFKLLSRSAIVNLEVQLKRLRKVRV
jgi:hypothetical protein